MAWGARLALIAGIALATVGLVYPQYRPTELRVGPDQVSHALIIYAVTLLASLAFPRIKPLLIVVVFGAAAIAVELAQLTGVLSGSAQVSDLVADFVGIIAAVAPLVVVRGRRVARAAGV